MKKYFLLYILIGITSLAEVGFASFRPGSPFVPQAQVAFEKYLGTYCNKQVMTFSEISATKYSLQIKNGRVSYILDASFNIVYLYDGTHPGSDVIEMSIKVDETDNPATTTASILSFVGIPEYCQNKASISSDISNSKLKSPFHDRDFVKLRQLNGLEILKNEVTYTQWNAIAPLLPLVNQKPWEAKNCQNDYFPTEVRVGPNFPVACLSFLDVQTYLHNLNSIDTTYTYRLPTYKEYDEIISLTFKEIDPKDFPNDFLNYAWCRKESDDTKAYAREVCTKKAILGLCDILGNLWEMTDTRFGSPMEPDRWIVGGTFLHYCGEMGGDFLSPSFMRGPNSGFRLIRTRK